MPTQSDTVGVRLANAQLRCVASFPRGGRFRKTQVENPVVIPKIFLGGTEMLQNRLQCCRGKKQMPAQNGQYRLKYQ